jgi:hypothetical protein
MATALKIAAALLIGFVPDRGRNIARPLCE